MLKSPFLVNTVVNETHQIVAIYAGHWRNAHRKGCEEYKAMNGVGIESRRSFMVISCGGLPSDINLIQSHKAIEHAAAALSEGGTMIVLAECSQGLGRDDFLNWFVPGGVRATALRLVQNYHVNGQTAWGLRSKAERFRIMFVSSLDPSVVRKTGLEPHPSLESALAAATPDRGYVLPHGASILPFPTKL
jgi:nickel-dependent lactate racemase